jgi:Pyruvate/2-oxoacid:ferredoxin oxidoreductase gamma subunit
LERALLVTGIGGQGVQLAAQVLARAAVAEGLAVQLFASYGGMMRGGNTDATLVFADGPIEAPPTVASAWAAIAMHPEHAAPVLSRLHAGALLFVDATVFDEPPELPGVTTTAVPATTIAIDIGNVMTASIVMVGAFGAITELVGMDALAAAISDALPPYRKQHVALNQHALRAGHDAARAMEAAAP